MLLSPDRISRAHCRASRDDSPPAIVRDNQHEAWPDLPPSLLTGCKSVRHNVASDGSLLDHRGSNTHSNIRYSSARLFALAAKVIQSLRGKEQGGNHRRVATSLLTISQQNLLRFFDLQTHLLNLVSVGAGFSLELSGKWIAPKSSIS